MTPSPVAGAPGSARVAEASGVPPLVAIPPGPFPYGEDRRVVSVDAFEMQRDPVTNAEYERFVLATGHRPPLYWKGGTCPDDLRDHPVVGVDYFDAMAYARWAGLDLPYEDEWERAARGTDARAYPWGEDPDLAANTARTGLKMTLPVSFHARNVSPDGCRDMVGNAWEMTHSPAPVGGLVLRGGSWYDFALYAKTFTRSATRADARNGTIGFRCVKRASTRADAPRAVPEAEVGPAIAARRSKGDLPDPNTWSPERRDLVPDLRRLRTVVAARKEDVGEELRLAAISGLARRIVPRPPTAIVPVPSPSPKPAPPIAPKTAPTSEPKAAMSPAPNLATPPAPKPAPFIAPSTAAPIALKTVPSPAPMPVLAPKIVPPASPAPSAPPPAPPPLASPPPVTAATPVAAAAPAPRAPAVPALPAGPVVLALPESASPAQKSRAGPTETVARAERPATATSADLRPREPAATFGPPPSLPSKSPPSPSPSATLPLTTPPPPAAAVPPAPRVREETSSSLRIVLVVTAFLAATILVVVILLRTSGGAAEPSPDEETVRLGLPALVASTHDADFPTILGSGVPMPDLSSFQKGGTLLVFARPNVPVGRDSAELGIEMHRRLRDRDLQVVLVIPRESLAPGGAADETALREALVDLGVTSDVKVLLDPADVQGPGRLRRGWFSVAEDAAAVLIEDGVETMRVVPPSSTVALSRAQLAPLVRAAVSRHGRRPLAPEPPSETDLRPR